MLVKNLPYYFNIEQLQKECDFLLDNVGLHKSHNQISLKHTEMQLGDKWYQGCGSLKYKFDENFSGKLVTNDIQLQQKDFCIFNNEIKDFYLKSVYDTISADYNIGRVRLMALHHKKVMSMHTDASRRIHVPVVTNENCMMVIDNNVFHLPADGSAYLTNTTKKHTAFNANHNFLRLHLLFDIDE